MIMHCQIVDYSVLPPKCHGLDFIDSFSLQSQSPLTPVMFSYMTHQYSVGSV